MSSYVPLMESRRDARKADPVSAGSALFPDAKRMDWIVPTDGSSPLEHTRKLVGDISAAMLGPTDAAATGPIPAAFTYFGQFAFHDMVFSRVFGLPDGSGHRLDNAVSQGLDLSGLYGRGPQVDGHLYESPAVGAGAPCRFASGLACVKDLEGNRSPARTGRDLPRLDMSGNFLNVGTGRRAAYRPLVADSRNDDNLILSQLHATLLATHNRLVDIQLAGGNRDTRLAYKRARAFLISAYRQVVVQDYMRRILDPQVWEHFFGGENGMSKGSADLAELVGLPLEFTFGASRFAHAMVRQFYTVNDHFAEQAGTLEKVLSFSSLRGDGDVPVEAFWAVDWKRFAEGGPAANVQHARRISPFFASELSSAKLSVDLEDKPRSVSFMDIWRCYELRLPSGQALARAIRAKLPEMDFPVLAGDRMLPTEACTTRFRFHAAKLKSALEAAGSFCDATPLSYYILQEGSVLGDDGARLGPVGSYIISATVAASLHRTADTNFFETKPVADIDPSTLAGLLALHDPALTSDRDLKRKLNKFIQTTRGN